MRIIRINVFIMTSDHHIEMAKKAREREKERSATVSNVQIFDVASVHVKWILHKMFNLNDFDAILSTLLPRFLLFLN